MVKLQSTFLLFFLLTACAVTQTPRQSFTTETRDVPYRVRGEGEENLRHRILVLPFLDPQSSGQTAILEESRQVVIRELGKTRRFVILEDNTRNHE